EPDRADPRDCARLAGPELTDCWKLFSGRVSHGENPAIFPGEVQAAGVAGKTGRPQSPIVGVVLHLFIRKHPGLVALSVFV
ncbi:MAG TPA: hypothetical protein VJY33_16680, partial [Isosphaeraceae bacterium]|nr:hypothetical protein [Isosphaeraceae bacterium]